MRDYGFNPDVGGYKKLIEIFEILDDKIEIIDRELILPDNYEDYIGNRQFGLAKKFYSYKNNLFNRAYTLSEYKEKERRYQEKLEQQKKKQEALQLEKIQVRKQLDKIKKGYGSQWKNAIWIVDNIGIYREFEAEMEYYWTLIGDRFIKRQSGSIELLPGVYEEIQNLPKMFPLSGRNFLSRKFKNKFGHTCGIIKGKGFAPKKEASSYGVYALYVNNELFYIGSTMRDFDIRFKEHAENIKNNSRELYVYSLIKPGDQIECGILIDAAKLNTNSVLTRRDIESMELGLISLYKPKGNLAGNTHEYKYREV